MKEYNEQTHRVVTKEQHAHYVGLQKLEAHYKRVSIASKIIFAEWHREKRVLMGFSKKKFAEVFGIDRRAVYQYEKCEHLPRDMQFYIYMVEDYLIKQTVQRLEDKKKRGGYIGKV